MRNRADGVARERQRHPRTVALGIRRIGNAIHHLNAHDDATSSLRGQEIKTGQRVAMLFAAGNFDAAGSTIRAALTSPGPQSAPRRARTPFVLGGASCARDKILLEELLSE
jgi:hypothetical protein